MKNLILCACTVSTILFSSCTIEINQDKDGNLKSTKEGFVCPMNCENGKTYTKEGNCKKCGMILQKTDSTKTK